MPPKQINYHHTADAKYVDIQRVCPWVGGFSKRYVESFRDSASQFRVIEIVSFSVVHYSVERGRMVSFDSVEDGVGLKLKRLPACSRSVDHTHVASDQ